MWSYFKTMGNAEGLRCQPPPGMLDAALQPQQGAEHCVCAGTSLLLALPQRHTYRVMKRLLPTPRP